MKKVIPFILILSIIFEPSYSISSCQCVAFRMDDVQDYWIDNVQIEVMEAFHKKNASLTIGIIGNIFGDDFKLVNYIENNLKNNDSSIEIANHGWNHEDFEKFNKTQQSQLLYKTNKKITKIFGTSPTVFIPPFNSFNNDTISAIRENKIQLLSAGIDQDTPNSLIQHKGVFHLPGNAETSNLIQNDTIWNFYNQDRTFVQIMSSIQKYGYAVVILHPQEFSVLSDLGYSNTVDKHHIKDLELLIDEIKTSGAKIVPLNKIPLSMNKKHNPYWLDRIFMWHDQGKITGKQTLSIINYLIEKKIIDF